MLVNRWVLLSHVICKNKFHSTILWMSFYSKECASLDRLLFRNLAFWLGKLLSNKEIIISECALTIFGNIVPVYMKNVTVRKNMSIADMKNAG